MLAYFPEIYPNELLYSVLGRLKCHLGTESSMSFLLDVFGHYNVRAGAYLQTNLGRLAANLPVSRGLTAERLAMETTLLPYFCAFQPTEARGRALAELIGDSRDAYLMPYQFGHVKDGARLPAALRYCPTCCEEMQQKHGEFYWRRDHQLPGVLVCPEHGVPLAESQVTLAQTKRHGFIAADVQNCRVNPASPTWMNHVAVVKLLHEFAISSNALLSPTPERSSDALKEEIVVALRSKGFGAGKRSLNLPLLREAFVTRFGPILDILPDAVPGDWLKSIALKYENPLTPIRYIFINLLIASMPLDEVSNPFGLGPWPCPNPLADHCGQMMISDCELSEEKGEVSGIFRCPCGYAFSRSSASVSRVNVLDFGPLFETRLRELVLAGTVPEEIAKALHVPHMTILNNVAKLGLKTSWKAPAERIKRPRVDRDAMRTAWTDGHNANPSLTTRQLHKKKLPTVYGWLRCNDRKWLDGQPPSQIGRSTKGRGKDWSSFDAAKVQSLKKEAAGLRVLDPPKRVSHSALLSVIGRYDWRRTHLSKLPQSISALTELAESTDDFRCRRIVWAAEELKRLDLPFSVTRLRRLAGLSGRGTPDVEEFLKRTVDDL